MKNEIQWFSIDPIPFNYGFCPSEEAWIAHLSEANIQAMPFPKEAMAAAAIMDGQAVVVISEELELFTVDGISAVIHECVHVWQAMMKSIQDDPTGEIEAYFIQKISSDILNAAGEWINQKREENPQ